MKERGYFFSRISIHLVFLVLALFSSRDVSASLPQKRVLVIYSEDKAHPAHELTDQGIRAAFRSNTLFNVQLYVEYLDLSLFEVHSHARVMTDYLNGKYAGTKIDTIITVYPAAIAFLMDQEGKVLPGVPIVACQIIRDSAETLNRSPWRSFTTGVIMGDNIAGVLDTALRLRPETKTVALIAGTAPNDAFGEQIFRRGLESYPTKFGLIDLTKLPIQEILARVGSLPPDTIVLYSSLFRDGASQSFVPRQALSLVSAAANRPVFGLYDSYMGYGIVGGRLISWEQLGREAAALAIRVMGGESPASIPFGGEQAYVDLYDWRELRRWRISEAEVPPGAEIRYRIPTFWEDHWGTIVSVIALISIETALIVGLLFNFRKRRKAERFLRESEERVRLAASSAGAGLWGADVDSGRIWATDRARELLGFAPEEPLNEEKVLSLIHPADRDSVRRSLVQAVNSGGEAILECRVVLPEGNVRWISARCRLHRSLRGVSKQLMGVCIDVTVRKLAEETLKQRENELMALTGRLIHTQEEELRRLSRDLHDDLTQRLAALAIDAGMLEKAMRPHHPETAQELAELKTKLIDVSDEVHSLSRQLHPSILEDLGLVEAVRAECDIFSRRTGIVVSFDPGNPPVSISNDIALCLYRVFQEGIQNISKHSKAVEARVVLRSLAEGVQLLIQDSGAGFDVNQVAGKGNIGLSSMRERVRLVNGTLSVVSEPGKGTEIQVSIPVGGNHVQVASADR